MFICVIDYMSGELSGEWQERQVTKKPGCFVKSCGYVVNFMGHLLKYPYIGSYPHFYITPYRVCLSSIACGRASQSFFQFKCREWVAVQPCVWDDHR